MTAPNPPESRTGEVRHRVLLICSHFAPDNAGAVIRNVKWAKWLPRLGWDVDVITSRNAYLPTSVDTFNDDLKNVGRVVRTPNADIRRIWHAARTFLPHKSSPADASNVRADAGLSSKSLASRYLVPDHYFCWVPLAVFSAVTMARKQHFDLILASCPLPSAAVAGSIVSRICGIPLVLDFRDPWKANPFGSRRPVAWLEAWDQSLEQWVVNSAAGVVTVSHAITEDFLSRHAQLRSRPTTTIRNGFDVEDFTNVRPTVFGIPTVLHAGNLYGSRSIRPVVAALELLLETKRLEPADIRVRLMGSVVEEQLREIDTSPARGFFEVVQPRPHSQAIAEMMGAHALLLIPGPGAGTLTGKLYEYLYAGRPIVAVAQQTGVADLLRAYCGGVVVAPEDHEALAEHLVAIAQGRFRVPSRTITLDDASFTRATLAHSLVQFFETVLDKGRKTSDGL